MGCCKTICNDLNSKLRLFLFFNVNYGMLIMKKVERGNNMPEISLFYGIRVTMYYDDHNPPHFHVNRINPLI